jgi:hypothetical protein
VQGGPERFARRLPPGFEIAGVSGSTLDKTEEGPGPGVITLVVRDPARDRHQFLLTLERSSAGGSFQEEVPFPSVDGAQRETGEVSFESVGTMELLATEQGDVRRMDVREVSAPLKGLARQPLLAAFRYHRKAGELPRVALDVKRFPDAAVLAAVAERAVVTTLVSAEGRTLTELTLTVRNHAQPFLKVALPEGATLLSAEVAGEAVKPVKGDDGTRVPLLRPGARPTGPYAVSFVYVHPGSPFAKRGEAAFALPRLDIPMSLVEWELFLPDRYKVSGFEGNMLPAELVSPTSQEAYLSASTGAVAEQVTVEADDRKGSKSRAPAGQAANLERRREANEPQQVAPSSNVFNLQRRVAGVLPVRIDIPHAGASYRFVRPLVLDEETTVRFRYKAGR